ncbi:hypothetical protein BDV93DRAFT_553820 [Ceratobasidium sp. AG-I]|nr:hypothetical protein BDV93DRAFT_553820 [Ceratobasidium sp. AG-I]
MLLDDAIQDDDEHHSQYGAWNAHPQSPCRISRPSTAPTPTTDSGPLLPTSSPVPSRQPSPNPTPERGPSPLPTFQATLAPAGRGSAPATAGIPVGPPPQGLLDWPTFLRSYANGEWDPNRAPNPPVELTLPAARFRSVVPALLVGSALSSSSTVTASLSPPLSTSSDNTQATNSSPGLAGPDRRPRISPDSRTSSIASRRGTTTPDLSGSSAHFKANKSPYIQAPRKVQRSQSDVEVRSPGGVPPTTHLNLPSPAIDRATTAATIRWAGSGVDVAPYALPSPEAAELLDPMRHALPVSVTSTAAAKSRLSKFWQGSPQDSSVPPPVISVPNSPVAPPASIKPSSNTRPLKRALTTTVAPRASEYPSDYFGSARTQSYRPSRSPRPELEAQHGVGTSAKRNGQPLHPTSAGVSLPTTTWSTRDSGPSHSQLADGCVIDLFPGDVLSVADSPNAESSVQTGPAASTSNGHPTVPDQLLTSLSSLGDNTEYFTPSETLILNDDVEQETPAPAYLIPPAPPDELERRKALYRFNILHTSRDVNFDRITHLCKLVFSTKMVIISLIDAEEQWFKSEYGFGTDSTGRNGSFCAHSILQVWLFRGAEPLVVLDATTDWRFVNNPYVTGPPNIRFYAGAPLRTVDGFNIGSLCVVDDKPREEFTPRQRHTLKEFAAIVMREMELWRDKIQLQVRDRIQTSMEKFTRECLELEESGTRGSNSMEKVYERAAKLVKRALDVEGAIVLDISQLECVEAALEDGTKSYSYRGDAFADLNHAPPTIASSPSAHASVENPSSGVGTPDRPFGRISAPVILGSAHTNFQVDHTTSLSSVDHERLSMFLSSYPDGKIYEHVVPSYLRDWAVPANASYSMIVPIFNIDHHPFALLCAYITDPGKHLLEGYELQFLRAIGVIILSAVLKRRMILADKAKSLFISNISHELRTPLHGILAAAELIADTKLTGTQSAFLKTIQSCGASLGETVNHVLDFTKLSGNREHTIPRSKTNLLTLVEDTVEGCWIGARARAVSEIGSVYSPPRGLPGTASSKPASERHVETLVDISHRERGWSCICEKAGIRRVLMNLIGNSLKFTADGYVYVGLREVAYNPDTRMITVELSVNDTGKGISKDFLTNQLFQPFSQENPLHTGTGLGLAIVNSIVRSETVGGQVDVWSQEGVGTEIKISFDVEETKPGAADSCLSGQFRKLSVCILGFSSHRGQQELYSTVSTVLKDWWGVSLTDNVNGAGVLLVNEDVQVLSDLVMNQEFSKPVILLTSARGDQRMMSIVKSFERSGGFCRLIFKPGGPSRLFAALGECNEFRAGNFHNLSDVHNSPNSPGSPSLSDSRTNSQTNDSTTGLTSNGSPSAQRELGFSQQSPHSPFSEESHCERESGTSPSLGDFSTVPLADEGSVMLESVAGTLSAIRKPRVLVVEDNPINRNLLSHWLKKRGMESDETVDGIEGVKAFQSAPAGHYQVLLVDLSMPNLGGIGCVTQIRAIERERKTSCAKIFALTGLATPEDKRRALTAGFDGYLIKPVSFKTLDGLFQKLASH